MVLNRRGVQMVGGVDYLKIDDAGLHTLVNGEPRLFAVDTVIVCAGQTPLRSLFDELQVAHGDGSFARRLAQLAKLDLLVLDDFAISPIGAAERNDLQEVLDDLEAALKPR